MAFQFRNRKSAQAYKGQSVLMTLAGEDLRDFPIEVGMFCNNTSSNKKGVVTFIDKNNLTLQITPLEVNDSFSGENPGIFSYNDLVEFTARPYFLRMLFDDIANAPVGRPDDTGAWDEFFDFAPGTFTIAYVIGNEVWLGGGGSNQNLQVDIFANNSSIINFIDEGGIFSFMAGDAQFSGAGNLVEVSLPNVINMNSFTFTNCNSLLYISLPKLTTIGGRSNFEASVSLTDVFLPSLTTIGGGGTFTGCTSIQHLSMPLLKSMPSNSQFYGCNNLKKMYIPKCSNIEYGGGEMFTIEDMDIELTIPLALMESSVHPTDPNIQYLLENNNVTLTTV